MYKDKASIAYGAVYMDRGEGIEIIKEQIDSFAKNKVTAVGFDIIGRPEQEFEAKNLERIIREYSLIKLQEVDKFFIKFLSSTNPLEDPRDNNPHAIRNVLASAFKNLDDIKFTAEQEDTFDFVENRDKWENNLALIKATFKKDVIGNKEADKMLLERLDDFKEFYLDVSKGHTFYDEYDSKNDPLSSLSNYFELPFDNCLFAFKEGFLVKWHGDTKGDYLDKTLIGFYIFKINSEAGKTGYAVYLIFDDVPLGKNSLGYYPIVFVFNNKKERELALFHPAHACLNKELCCIDEAGNLKAWAELINRDKNYYCQEMMARDSIIETLIFIIMKVNTTTPIKIKKKNKKMIDSGIPNPKTWGWPFTKGNLPKEGYTEYLDGKRYVYEKDAINYGSGTQHRYRYDVRRHPRVVGDRIIWVDSHQRGSGKYLRKVYSNRHGWFVQYFFYHAEKLTRYRVAEILLIRIIHIFRKFRK